MNNLLKTCWLIAAAGSAALALLSQVALAFEEAKTSRAGHYEGYAPVIYDGSQLSSFYVTVRDGTKLAVDLIRPTRDGVVANVPMPVIWMHSPYNRRPLDGKSQAETYPSGPAGLVKYGYVVAVVDFRGLFASYGSNKVYNFGEFAEPATTDAYDITEWLAKQPWSSGKIGMWGCSATGASQMQAAWTLPPSLKAIFPLSSSFDEYSFLNYGGIPSPSQAPREAPAQRDAKASPVDGADGQKELAEAMAQHSTDEGTQNGLPFRDSKSTTLGDWWTKSSSATHVKEFAHSRYGVYAAGNWDETGTKLGTTLIYGNMPKGHAKLLLAPEGHCQWQAVDSQYGLTIQTEQLRFFDYWLKGIQNGVMSEPAVTYFTYHAPEASAWRTAKSWPLSKEIRTDYYLSEGELSTHKSTTVSHESMAMGEAAKISTVTLFPAPGGLSYETQPLAHDTEVTGQPVLHVWISTSAPDVDVVTQIEDVAPDGTTESHQMVGRLRASDRAEFKAPYKNYGMPYHTFLSQDVRTLTPDKPVSLAIEMMPMSYIFLTGHRIRLRVTFSDPAVQQDAAPPVVTVLSSAATRSALTLPIIP